MVLSLTASDVKSMFSSSNYRKGHSYYTQGRVKELAYDSDKKAWSAVVSGTARYKVKVKENSSGLELACNCPAFHRYDEECKHVAAVMIKIQETETNRGKASSSEEWLQARQQEFKRQQEELVRQQQERQSAYVKQLTNRFIHAFTNQQQDTMVQEEMIEKQPLMVEWICSIRKSYRNTILSLEMKVGHKRTYVVKNIVDFL